MRALTPAQLAFCSAIVQQRLNGAVDNHTAAYRLAYPDCKDSTVTGAASPLFHKPHIQEEIQRQMQAAGITKEYISGKLQWVINEASKDREFTAVTDAVFKLAKVNALVTDISEVTNKEGALSQVDGEALWAELQRRMKGENVGETRHQTVDKGVPAPTASPASTLCVII